MNQFKLILKNLAVTFFCLNAMALPAHATKIKLHVNTGDSPRPTPYSQALPRLGSSRSTSRHVSPYTSPRQMARRLRGSGPHHASARPITPMSPNLWRRTVSEPMTELQALGLPLPPDQNQIAANPRHEERYNNLMYQWVFENELIFSRIRDMTEDSGSVRIDIVCGMTERTMTSVGSEDNNYDMIFRIKLFKNALADILGQDPRRYKVGKIDVAVVDEEHEECCAIKVSPYRHRSVFEALDHL